MKNLNRGFASILSPNPPSQQYNNNNIFASRVSFVILDDLTEKEIFNRFGEWSSIGSIFFSNITEPDGGRFEYDNFAKPLFPNTKIYPLKNEIVYIVSLPNNHIQGSVNNVSYYYFQPVNIWNSNHHNAIPDPIHNDSPSNQEKYNKSEAGQPQPQSTTGEEIELGNTFKERSNIRTLLPFEGDIFHEGRWGQSIRFGSTVGDSNIENPWSKSGNNGDPITIIRNSQYEDNRDPWLPQIEDINKDESTTYLTSTQKIPIETPSTNYESYDNAPTSPEEYNHPQQILKSGRLLFVSNKDSILFNSVKSINLNSIDSVNVDTKKVVVNTNSGKESILLGDKKAKESLVLGDKFMTDFKNLLQQVISLGTALQTPIGTPTPYTPNVAIVAPAVQVTEVAKKMLGKIESYKSKVSKTK